MVSGLLVVQAVGITASMFAAGQTATFTTAVVPSLLKPKGESPEDEKRLIAHWRSAYVAGFYITPPPLILSSLSFGSLAYAVRQNRLLCTLYAVAAVMVPAIVPVHTWRFMRPCIGALCLRAEKLAGPGEGTKAELLGKDEPPTLQIEEKYSTEELVRLWGQHNVHRSATGLVGAAIGVWAALLHAKLLGEREAVRLLT